MLDSTREKIRQKYTQAEIGRYMGVAQQTRSTDCLAMV